MNLHIITGNVGKEPELKHINDKPVCSFTIASSDFYRDKEGKIVEVTDWHNVVFWGKHAETIAKHVQKGTQLLVEGKVKTRSWEKDGIKHYSTETVGERFEMFGKKKESTSAPAQTSATDQSFNVPPMPENDLPF